MLRTAGVFLLSSLTVAPLGAQAPAFDLGPERAALQTRLDSKAEIEGLLPAPDAAMLAAAENFTLFEQWLARPRTETEVLGMIRLRHPAIAAARERVRAAFLIHDQPDRLEDIVQRRAPLDGPCVEAPPGIAARAFAADPLVLPIWGQTAELVVGAAWSDLRREIAQRCADWIEMAAAARRLETEIANLDRRIALLAEIESLVSKQQAVGRADAAAAAEVRRLAAAQKLEVEERKLERHAVRVALNGLLRRDPEAVLGTLPEPEAFDRLPFRELASLADALELDHALHAAHVAEKRAKIAWRHASLARAEPRPAPAEIEARRREIEIEALRAARLHEARAAEVGASIAAVHAGLDAAEASARTIAAELLPSARSRLEAERASFAAGKGGWHALAEAVQAVFDAEDAKVRLEGRRQALRATMLRSTGRR